MTSSIALLLSTALSALVFVLFGAMWDRFMGLERGFPVTAMRLFAGWLMGSIVCSLVTNALSGSFVVVLVVTTLV